MLWYGLLWVLVVSVAIIAWAELSERYLSPWVAVVGGYTIGLLGGVLVTLLFLSL